MLNGIKLNVMTELKIETWKIKQITGYEPKTTFYEDLSIAEAFGIQAIEDTLQRSFKHWKQDYVYITELTMACNWKLWRWYEKNDDYCKLYDRWWRRLDDWCMTNLKGDELEYYVQVTD